MKDPSKILYIVQARLNSERCPNKMLRPFGGTTLFELCLDKVLASDIPNEQFRASVHEKRLRDIVDQRGLYVYNRSYESANEDDDLKLIYEWWDQFPDYEYAVIINACNLFLEVDTINQFVDTYIQSRHDGLFGVIPKKQYYWNSQGDLITPWPKGHTIMNTKAVGETLEAAHCLYAGRLDLIGENAWMGKPPYRRNSPALFEVSEFEALDIDWSWQFDLYTSYWEKVSKGRL